VSGTSEAKRTDVAIASLAAVLVAFSMSGCGKAKTKAPPRGEPRIEATVEPSPAEPAPPPPPPPRKGMIWIPEGELVAGTPPDRTPRLADEELPGTRIQLHGFYIDEYAYPNEASAIPKTNVTQEEAAALCEEQGKRLCTELEWERACKGPENTTYEYGDGYRASECATGSTVRLTPSGLRVGCKSGFGVHDMHGGPWEWTASPWGRGTSGQLVALRGGNSEAGEVTGRCANGMGRPKTLRAPTIGFRCCAGEPNPAQVELEVVRERALERIRVDADLGEQLLARLPEEVRAEMPADVPFELDRMLHWHPIGNEELLLATGCAKAGKRSSCGLVIARETHDGPLLLAWVPSGVWSPRIYQERDTKSFWVYGATEIGAFRQQVVYGWGRVGVSEVERKVKVPPRTL